MHEGHAAELPVVSVNPETLGVRKDLQRYTRIGSHRWLFEQVETGFSAELEVVEFGLVLDYPTLFRRLS